MNCSEWEERIGLYAGGDLAGLAGEVERHLAECAGCREFAAGLQESLAWLKEAHAETPAEAHFAAVRARVMGELGRRRAPVWRRAWVFGLAAAALVLAAVVGLRVGEGPRVAPPVTVARLPEAPVVERGPLPRSPKREYGCGSAGRPVHPSVQRSVHRSVQRPVGQPVRRAAPAVKAVRTEPLLIKLETDNPDVVIYWIAETRGDE